MKKSKIIMLNSEQRQAVETGAGTYACLAGPGSGKTTVIVERYLNLIEQGFKPEEIISLTFTAEAAAEMKKRAEFAKMTKNFGKPHGFLTFHSLALSFVTIERNNFPFQLASFPLATQGQSAKIVGDLSRLYHLDFKQLRNYISQKKRDYIRPDKATLMAEGKECNLAMAYRDYEKRCHDAGFLDFDSLLLETVTLLENNLEVRRRWQYKWIQVDESQDADIMQWRLVQLLSQTHNNVFAVGDGNQCIYEWRSAHPELFLNFNELFPDSKFIYLGQNYRSTQKLVEFCKNIAPIKNDLLKHFRSDNELGREPLITQYIDGYDEAEGVLETIKTCGIDSAAVLGRTNRQLRPYEDLFANKGVKYHLLGKSGFWSQSEVRNIVAFLQLSVAPFDSAILTALRSPFNCTRFIRKKELIEALTDIKKASQEDDLLGPVSYWEILESYKTDSEQQNNAIQGFVSFVKGLYKYKSDKAPLAVKSIIQDLKAFDYYDEEEEAQDVDNSPRENIEEIIKIATRFNDLRELLEHIRKVQAASRSKKGVAISTIHQAKGKEWNNVFLTGCQEGLLPHKNGELPEEERIFFVACSRAGKQLIISYTGPPSRFLKQHLETTA